ncbi:MAG: DUF4003 family protein [Sarcina sp.]
MKQDFDLFLEHLEDFDSIQKYSSADIYKRKIAFLAAIQNEKMNGKVINDIYAIIKSRTFIFSALRSKENKNLIASSVYRQLDKEKAIDKINELYKLVNKELGTTDYSMLVAIILFKNLEKINLEDMIDEIKRVYQFMNKECSFSLTKTDYILVLLIVVNFKDNISEKIKNIEDYYIKLKKEKISDNINIKKLSFVLALFSNNIDKEINKVLFLRKELKASKISVDGGTLVLLGVSAGVDIHYKDICYEIVEIDNELKDFSIVTIDEKFRLLMANGFMFRKNVEDKTIISTKLIDIFNFISLIFNEEDAMEIIDVANNIV